MSPLTYWLKGNFVCMCCIPGHVSYTHRCGVGRPTLRTRRDLPYGHLVAHLLACCTVGRPCIKRPEVKLTQSTWHEADLNGLVQDEAVCLDETTTAESQGRLSNHSADELQGPTRLLLEFVDLFRNEVSLCINANKVAYDIPCCGSEGYDEMSNRTHGANGCSLHATGLG